MKDGTTGGDGGGLSLPGGVADADAGTADVIAGEPSPSDDREQMLATLSHDLKNPLSAILVGAQNITRLVVPEDVAPRLRRYAEAIQRAGHRMNDLLRDILDLARLDRAALPMDLRSRPVDELVAAALKPFEEPAAARQVTLRRQVPDHLSAHCDERRISQVIGNMVANALKVCREGASVDVSVEPRGSELVFAVRDTGSGITAGELPKVFGPYWHGADNMRPGMGIGLPLAKAIIEAHGGRVWAESAEGQGSTFYFTVPAA